MNTPNDTLRACVVVSEELLRDVSVDIHGSIDRKVERELTSKVFDELKTHKSIIVSLAKYGEIKQLDKFTSSITTDINIFSVDDFIQDSLDVLNSVVNNSFTAFNKSDYMAGANDALNLMRVRLKELKLNLEK